jgi:hypothetical protein
LLELYGKGYVIEHCISLFSERQKEKTYRIYVTDCLKVISENTTHLMSNKGIVDCGSHMTQRWYDIVNVDIEEQKKIEEFNNTSTDDFVDDIWSRMKKGGKKE